MTRSAEHGSAAGEALQNSVRNPTGTGPDPDVSKGGNHLDQVMHGTMKALFTLTGVFSLAFAVAADEAPRGTLLELHSCEVYAGGCVVGSEESYAGRYMLRVWDFSGGEFNGTDLKGQRLAVLQMSEDNLAVPGSRSGDAVVYLPESADETQRRALLAWLLSSHKDFRPERLETRIGSLDFKRDGEVYRFQAGDWINVVTGPMSCETTACGEALWYEPRTSTTLFTVAVNREARIHEPYLKLDWADRGRRSVFLGRFGEPGSARDVYVTMNEFCGVRGNVF